LTDPTAAPGRGSGSNGISEQAAQALKGSFRSLVLACFRPSRITAPHCDIRHAASWDVLSVDLSNIAKAAIEPTGNTGSVVLGMVQDWFARTFDFDCFHGHRWWRYLVDHEIRR
jgi:hypothetical protein